jgi:hypothetical protein
MIYYGRDAIHETWLVFFLLLTLLGNRRFVARSSARPICGAYVLGGTGMILTKETYIIHFGAIIVGRRAPPIVFQVYLRRAISHRATAMGSRGPPSCRSRIGRPHRFFLQRRFARLAGFPHDTRGATRVGGSACWKRLRFGSREESTAKDTINRGATGSN